MDIVSTKDTYDFFNEKYNNCEIRYGDLKKQLAEDINNFCAPIREKIIDIRSNEEYMEKVARMGAEKARESAAKTLAEVREIIGFRPYWFQDSLGEKKERHAEIYSVCLYNMVKPPNKSSTCSFSFGRFLLTTPQIMTLSTLS